MITLRTKQVVARKPHRCDSCWVVAIQPGDAYTRQTNVADGRIYDWVSCAGCTAMSLDVFTWAGDPEYGIDVSTYHDWAREMRDVDERALAYLVRIGEIATEPVPVTRDERPTLERTSTP